MTVMTYMLHGVNSAQCSRFEDLVEGSGKDFDKVFNGSMNFNRSGLDSSIFAHFAVLFVVISLELSNILNVV